MINIGVWLIEQLVSINFEMLSVSYIVTELFLLGLNVIMTENENLKTQISTNPTHTSAPSYENTQESEENKPEDSISEVQRQLLLNLERLTKTERIIFDYYIDGLSTKEIMAELKITENTIASATRQMLLHISLIISFLEGLHLLLIQFLSAIRKIPEPELVSHRMLRSSLPVLL